jgi:long-chain fatty acid transport protein
VADIPKGLRDVLGLRVGGEFVPVQNRWALRAGAFYETPAVGRSLQNVDMFSGERFGVSVGGTWRGRFGAEGRTETGANEQAENGGEGGDGTDATNATATTGATSAGDHAGHRRGNERPPEHFPTLDVHLGLAQIFVGTLSQDSPSDRGLSAIAGTACNGGGPTASGACPPLADGTTPEKFRTNWPVNLGRLSSSVTLINIGATYRF